MKKTKPTKTENILKALKQLQRGVGIHTHAGICTNVEYQLPLNQFIEKTTFESAFKSWEHFSGNLRYPVPATTEKASYYPAEENQFAATRDKWSRTTKYGCLRRNLLRHMVKHFEAKVAKLEAKRKSSQLV